MLFNPWCNFSLVSSIAVKVVTWSETRGKRRCVHFFPLICREFVWKTPLSVGDGLGNKSLRFEQTCMNPLGFNLCSITCHQAGLGQVIQAKELQFSLKILGCLRFRALQSHAFVTPENCGFPCLSWTNVELLTAKRTVVEIDSGIWKESIWLALVWVRTTGQILNTSFLHTLITQKLFYLFSLPPLLRFLSLLIC